MSTRFALVLQLLRDLFTWSARNGSFVLTFLGMTGAMLLAVSKDADVNTLLPTLLGLFLGQKAGTSMSAHWAASKDGSADTAQVIREIEGIAPPAGPKSEG